MPAGGYLLIGLLVGGLLGLLIGWLYGRARVPAPDDRLANELRQQLSRQNTDLEKLRDQIKTEASFRAAAEASRTAADERVQQAEAAERESLTKLNAARQETDQLQTKHASLSAQLEAERRNVQNLTAERADLRAEAERLQSEVLALQRSQSQQAAELAFLNERLKTERAQLETLQQKFTREFEAVAHKLLVENSSRFGQQSAESLDKLLGPLKENLQDFKTRLENVHKDTVAHSTLLKDQICRIGTEAANLSKALKGDVKVLGNWGENMLDQILEKSGLQLGLHYRRQSTGRDAEGDTRFLDVVIELPENKHLVIDSKVSLRCYEEHVNSEEPVLRGKRLQEHIDCIRTHFKGLGAKRYQDTHGISAPDFVLMYIPIEAAFFAAIGHEPKLFSEALDRNVVLTTNSTLLATLRTVAHVWRLADQQKYALEIADRGGKLYDKFVGFVEDLQGIGEALDNSQRLLREANKKLHTGTGNLVGQVEKLKMLGVKATKSLSAVIADERETPGIAGGNGGQMNLLGSEGK